MCTGALKTPNGDYRGKKIRGVTSLRDIHQWNQEEISSSVVHNFQKNKQKKRLLQKEKKNYKENPRKRKKKIIYKRS